MNALSSAIAKMLVPVIKDPHLVWIWGSPAVALFIETCVFYWRYRWMNNDEFMTVDEQSDHKLQIDPAASPGKAPAKDVLLA